MRKYEVVLRAISELPKCFYREFDETMIVKAHMQHYQAS